MKKVYGIIGSGSVSEKALRAALNDLPKDAVYYVPHHKNVETIEHIYDWMIDNEVEFVVVGKAGPTLTRAAVGVEEPQPETNLNASVLTYVEGSNPTILVLWDDTVEPEIIAASEQGYTILELSNGLAPIIIEDDDTPEEPQQEEAPVEVAPEEATEGFSREELVSMPIAAVKRHAVQKGIDVKGRTKSELIDDIIDGFVPDIVTESEIPSEEVVLRDDPLPTLSSAVTPVSVILILNNGTSITVHGDQATMNRILAVL